MPTVVLMLVLPLVELAGLVAVARQLGGLATLALVLASAALGVALLRRAMRPTAPAPSPDPAAVARQVARQALAVAAGVLLLVPGLLTDALALALLVPAVQRVLLRRFLGRLGSGSIGAFRFGGAGQPGAGGPFPPGPFPPDPTRPAAPSRGTTVIEGEFVREHDRPAPPRSLDHP